MNKILVYTFYNPRHLTFKILKSLPNTKIDKYFLGSLKSLLKIISERNYSLILGLGDYRKDSKKIRIENKFINKYGKNKISENGEDFFEASWKLKLGENMIYSDKTSFGPCNRSAYLISDLIKQNNLHSKIAFVHVPGSFDLEKVRKFLLDCII